MAAGTYFSASFGDVPMLVTSISTEAGRDVAVQSPAMGDRHTLSDRGQRLRRSTCQVLFCDQPGFAPYLERYDRFRALFESPDPQLLTHPLDGTYRALGESLQIEATSDELCVRVTCTFLAHDPPPAVFPVTSGSVAPSGLESVDTAIADLVVELESAELSSNVTTDALEQVTEWTDAAPGSIDPQEVILEAATLATQIDDEIQRLKLTTDNSRWPAYRAMIVLRYEIVRAAQAVTADSDAIFEIFVEEPRPILAICAEIYGARDARERAATVTKLNRLRTPGRVPRGTTLKMPRVAA